MTNSHDTDAVKAVLHELSAAWEQGDADAYGALMTEDATYVTFVGTLYQGRRDIVESHRTLFAKFLKGTKLADEILGIRFPGPDLAVVNSRGDTYKGDKRPSRLTKTQTTVLVRESDGQWRISAFHNTKGKPLMEALSFKLAPGTVPAEQQHRRA